MQHNQQTIKVYFEAVQQELAQRMQHYQAEIDSALQVHVPTEDQIELRKFVAEQRKHYEEVFSDEWGKPQYKKFSWQQYGQYIQAAWSAEELETDLQNDYRKKDIIQLHVNKFIYAEVIDYLNSQIHEKKQLPDWEEKKHEVIIRYEKMNRKKGDGITELTLKETIAYYEIQSQFGVSLSTAKIPISNIAMAIALMTKYDKDSIEKEINNLTPQDYRAAFKKIQEIATHYSPPLK